MRSATCAIALLAGLLLLPACGNKGAANEDEVKAPDVPTIAATVGKAERQTIAHLLIVRGTVSALPNEDVKISALVAGRVVAMPVAEGDVVAKGQVLAEIERRPYDDQRRQAVAALDQAKANLENAKANLDRTQSLFKQGIAAGKEVEDARAQFAGALAGIEQASAGLDIATRNVDRTSVTSPIAGQVVKRLVATGEQVDGTGAQPIVEVANLDVVELAANVPAEYLAVVRAGLPVAVVCQAFPDRTLEGQVIAVAPAVDPISNAALVRVRIQNAGHLLKVGMFAEARIAAEEHKNAVVVPASAIEREQQDTFVYVLKGDVAERTPVTIGIQTPETAEVLKGVSEGDQVLTSNIHGLGEKAKLQQGRGK